MSSSDARPRTDAAGAGPGRSPWRVFLVVWVLLSALSAVWALATPIGASPDEPAHIVRAASVVRGELIGTPSKEGNQVLVPAYIAQTQHETCFAYHPERVGTCHLPPLAHPYATTWSHTTAGLYNPLYYAAVGWPTLLIHDTPAIYVMRIVSGILTSLFAALAFAVLWRLPRRGVLVLGFSVAMTPMLLFLDGSVNPNGIEATGTLAVFAGMIAIVLNPDRSLLLGRAMLVMAAGIVAVNARGLSPLWVLLAVALPLLLVPLRDVLALLRRPAVLLAAGGLALGTIAALAWTVGTNSLLNAVQNPDQTPQSYPGVGTNPLSGFYITIVRTVEYLHGVIGVFGWLDTPAPPEVFFIWFGLMGIVLMAALVFLRSRALVFAGSLLAAYVIAPPVIQGVYITGGGIIWQGRYAMPIFLCVIVGLAVVLADRFPVVWSATAWRRLTWISLIVVAFGQFYSFESTLRRYSVTPIGSLKQFLFGTPPWSPPGGVLLSLVLFAALLGIASVVVFRAVRRVDAVVTEEAAEEHRVPIAVG